MVMPLDVMSGQEGEIRIAFGLIESLIADLAKLTGLSVMAHASILDLTEGDDRMAIDSLRQDYGVTHLVRGSLMRENDRVVVSVQLVDTGNGRTLWAERLAHSGDSAYQLQEELALSVASKLSVQLQPEERERLAESHTRDPEAWVLYRQGLVTLMPPNDVTRVQTARVLFQRARQLDPSFAGSYAGESFSHSVTVLFLKADSPEEELTRAITLAERAIEIDPDFAMGYAVLSFAQAMAGNYELAMRNARRATEIQPGDAFTRFIMGMNQIIAGQPVEAIEQLLEALRLDPFEPRTPYLNVLAIAQYASGFYLESLRTMSDNLGREGPRGPHMAVFQAAALAQLGRREEAGTIFRALQLDYPSFPVEGWLAHWLRPEGDLQQTLALLTSLAG
jgi:adenylate cyclase